MFALGAEDTAHVTATRGSRPRVCSVGVFAAVVLVILAAAGGLAQPAAAADCKPYIFIGARGSGQPDGFGDVVGATKMRLETLAAGSDLVESIPSARTTAIGPCRCTRTQT